MTCSAPPDCAEIERRHATGIGLLVDGGSSRGNLLSGEAQDVILTVSRMEEEKKSNPGYRAFLANGDNVTRTLVLFGLEVVLEWIAAARAIRRDVRPRGHRGGIYPLMRAALCVFVRDLIVSGVLTDMMRGRPAVYATFSSYDEVAHHSGLERADTLEALRKLDAQFAQIERARRYAPRPYEIVVLSDHGQTQGATFKQRNGYGLDELVERSLARGEVSGIAGGDEQSSMVGLAVGEATGKQAKKAKNDVSDQRRRRARLRQPRARLPHGGAPPPDARGDRRAPPAAHPRPTGASACGLAARPLVSTGPSPSAPSGAHYLADGRIEGEDPLAPFSPTAPAHLLRTDGFAHVADIMVGSFYDPELEEGCAFEELICFHGGIGGWQTRPFILHPCAPRRARRAHPRRRERPRHPHGLAEVAPGRPDTSMPVDGGARAGPCGGRVPGRRAWVTTNGALGPGKTSTHGGPRLRRARAAAAATSASACVRTLTFWLRPEFLLRVVSRFQKVAGFDRAIALASGALTATIPLLIVTSAVATKLGGKGTAERIIDRYELTGGGAEAVRDIFSPPSGASTSIGLIGFLFLLVAVLSFTRAVQRLFEQSWELEALSVRNTFNGLIWVAGLAAYLGRQRRPPQRSWGTRSSSSPRRCCPRRWRRCS